MTEPTQSEIDSIVKAAKALADAPEDVPDIVWNSHAEEIIITAKFLNAEVSANVAALAERLNQAVEKEKARSTDGNHVLPPKPCEETASSLCGGDSNEKKRKYDSEILPQHLCFGAFGLVPSYLEFSRGLGENNDSLSSTSQKILNEDVTGWCPKEGRTSTPENPRSVQLTRILSNELASDQISVVHQTPIQPKAKRNKQDVDIAVFVETTSSNDAQVACVLEYKPEKDFSLFESQASCYGTDYMSISNRSVVVVQAYGTEMKRLAIRAFGIVPWSFNNTRVSTTARHRKSLLFEGDGPSALSKLVSGLKRYLHSYREEIKGKWYGVPLSNVTSLHKGKVVKVYDYRTRNNVPQQDRRVPNLDLVQRYIDPAAVLENPETDLSILIMTFLERPSTDGFTQWFDPVPACKLGEILEILQSLHGEGYVHGDIRLLNIVPHAGKLVDFDITRKEGQVYPSTLADLPQDGKRAAEVANAISLGSIGELSMCKNHDLESMLAVLQKFEPCSATSKELSVWWNENIRDRSSAQGIFDLVDKLKGFSDSELRVGLLPSLNVKNPAGTHSPEKPKKK